MASIFTPTNISSATGPYAIDTNDCIGDSVGILNANTNYLASLVAAVSSTTSTQIYSLSSLIYTPPAGGVIEYLSNVCDGSQVQGRGGTYTWPNVSASQSILTTTYVDVDGSKISYKPPIGTKKVIYRLNFHNGTYDNNPRLHFKFYIAGAEVEYARFTTRADGARQCRDTFEWAIGVGGTASSQTGRQSTWTVAKELKLMSRCYNTSYRGSLHVTGDWDGAASNQLSIPTLTIIATT